MTILHEDYTYREAKNADGPIMRKVVFEVLAEYGLIPDPEGIDADLMQVEDAYKNGYFGVIEDKESATVGTFGLFAIDKNIGEIRKMYLLPSARGNGIGKWMVNFLIEKAKTLGFKELELETASPLIEAIGLYQKLGFKEINIENKTERCDKSFVMHL